MEYDEHSTQVMNFVSGLMLGAVIGAGVALLTAPQSGRKTRKKLRRRAVDVRSTASDRFDDIAADVRSRVDDALDGARARLGR